MSKVPIKLSVQFVLIALAALLAAGCVFFAVVYAGRGFVDAKIKNPQYIERIVEKKVGEFQGYVTGEDVASNDVEAIKHWVNKENNVVLSVYVDGKMVFDSMAFHQDNLTKDIMPPWRHRNLYTITFADQTADIELFVLIGLKEMSVIMYIAIAASIITFALIYISFIRRKIRYITDLEKEVNILESGDLSYKVTVKGNDELTYLARSIDNMRLSINERQAEEEKARWANHKLVTSMSHDLRTPLTILLGFLEILDGKKYNSSEELENYINKAKNKAFQIKELSDRIFEYFFAFNLEEGELNRDYYSTEVVCDMVEDYVFSLEEKGFVVKCENDCKEGMVYIDPKVFSRVFDNIFSNILKYADKTKTVDISLKRENDTFVAEIANAVAQIDHKEESTNIGLQVCTNIVCQHNGQFSAEEKDGKFVSVVKLKLKK